MSDKTSTDDLAGKSDVRKNAQRSPANGKNSPTAAKSGPAQKTGEPAGKAPGAKITGAEARQAREEAKAKAKAEKAKAAQQAAEEIDAEEEEVQHFSKRFFIWASTSWGSSALVHLLLIVGLGLWMIPAIVKPKYQELVAVLEDRPEELLNQVLEEDITPSSELSPMAAASALSVGIEAALEASLEDPTVKTEVTDTPTEVKVDVGTMNVFASQGRSLATDLPEGTLGDAHAIVDNYGDAMDRITQEILNQLAKSKVLVIWVFDQSESMQDDRAEIMARIERVYQELGISKLTTGDALLTAVTSYGSTMLTHTNPPTYDTNKIIEAMKSVPNDPSGTEMMCQAVGYSIAGHRKFATSGRRQMMLILVTDESGDMQTNQQYLESTIAEAKAARTRVYVLGREAVFGYPYAHMIWDDPETKIRFWIRIDRGPETPFPEQLQVDGYHRRFDAHPSGFGPYEQTRMARQTGGIFFMLPSPEALLHRRDDRKYALEAMRPYLPDLRPRSEYVTERDGLEMRRMIWKVISDLNPYQPELASVVQVRVEDFPIDNADFAREAQVQIARATTLIRYYKEAEQAMASVESLKNREASPRWRANFEIVHAQTKAYQVQLYNYIQCLEDFVKNPKPIKNIHGPKRKTNFWDIGRVAKSNTGDTHAALMDEAAKMYRQVIVDHPGTPYAARAEFEIRRGWGCDLHEDYEDPRRSQVKVPNY